jgi:hypothetical protein
MNGSGRDEGGYEIGATLRRLGCIANRHGSPGLSVPPAAINEHPVAEAARLWSQCVRIFPRRQLVGYAVEGGKSILWFRRYSLGTGGNPSKTVIEPGAFGIRNGYEYAVGGTGSIVYATEVFAAGSHFVGQESETDFWVLSGSPIVWEIQTGILDQPGGADMWAGIVEQVCHEAPVGGFTNEWLMGVQFKPYHPSPSSLWKPGAYSDYFCLNDPAAFYAPEVSNDPALAWQLAYGERVKGRYGGTLIAEMPTGYRYMPVNVFWSQQYLNQNYESRADWDKFCKSRRIYEPDVEIESCEAVTEGTTELVKVTMTGRFHSTSGAPSSVIRDVSTWNLTALQAEPFRTADNGIRMYLAHAATGRNFTPLIGDNAWNSKVQDLPDNPYGSYYPHFYAVKLIPEPYEDDNDTQDQHDTPLFQDPLAMAETYLRVMAEGCVDHDQSLERLLKYITDNSAMPDSWGVHDYRHEELLRQAFGGSSVSLMPSTPTVLTDADSVRIDAPHGFGPPPSTSVSAEVFNRLVKAVNLLTRFRLMIPYDIQAESWVYEGSRESNIPGTFSTTGNMAQFEDRVDAPNTPLLTAGPTALGVVVSATASASCSLGVHDNPGPVMVDAARSPFRWWIEVANGIEAAFPPIVAELVSLSSVQVLVQRYRTRKNQHRTVEDTAEEGESLSRGFGWDPIAGWWYRAGEGYMLWSPGAVNEDGPPTVALESPGTVWPPDLPAGDMAIGRQSVMSNGDFDRPASTESSLQLYFVPGQTLVIEVPLAG